MKFDKNPNHHEKPKVLLLFCPIWETTTPYASLAYLAQAIDKYADVTISDLNIEMQDYLLSDRHAASVHLHINKSHNNFVLRQKESLLYHIVAGRLDEAKAALRSSKTIPDERANARRLLHYGRHLSSLPYYPAYFDDRNYFFDDSKQLPNIEILAKNIENRKTNLFLDLFCKHFTSLYSQQAYDVVGASLTSVGQIVPTFSILKKIRSHQPKAKILLGGAILPYLYDSGAIHDSLFDFIDYFVIGPGEDVLNDCCSRKYPEKRIVTIKENNRKKIHNIFKPTFRHHPRRLYLSSTFILPYIATRQCYWNKCAFCSLTQSRTNIGPKRPDEIASEIDELICEHGTHYVSFNDSAISVPMFRKLCNAITENGVQFYWTCLLRFEPEFQYEDFLNAHANGCRLIQFGMESGSQRLLNQMRKGVKLQDIENILYWCNKAGIFVNCFIFYGFPTENRDDCQQTMNFLEKNSGFINNLAYGPYRLERLSKVYRSPSEFNIKTVNTEHLELLPFVRYALQDHTKMDGVDAFELSFNQKFCNAPFLGKYLDNAEEFPAFFELLCNDVSAVKMKSQKKARVTKCCKEILFQCPDFRFVLAPGEIEMHDIPNGNRSIGVKNAWLVRKIGLPIMQQINSTYAAMLRLLLETPLIWHFSRALHKYTKQFMVPENLAQRDLRMMLFDLYNQGLLQNIQPIEPHTDSVTKPSWDQWKVKQI